MFEIFTRKTKYGYRGFIKCMNGKNVIWTESTGITRICREDAIEDAKWLKKDREATIKK